MTQPIKQTPANPASIALARMVASVGGASLVEPVAVDDEPPLDAVTLDADTGAISAVILLGDGVSYDLTLTPAKAAPAAAPAQVAP